MFQLEEASTVFVVDARPEDYVALLADPLCEGLNLRFFRTAGSALRAARNGEPDLWVVNMDLPDRGGTELCDMLRSRLYDGPIYMVSDDYAVEAELDARRCGANMFLCKPVVSEWLGTGSIVVND